MNVAAVATSKHVPLGAGAVISRRGAVPDAERSILSMYAEPPNEMLTLEDFEVLAFERLKVLKAIEDAKSRGLRPKDINDLIRDTLKLTIGSANDTVTQRRDQVSHHILRLAYCQTEDQRRWFMMYECALFKYRAERETPERILAFMKRHELNFLEATDEEKSFYRVQLRQVWEANPLPVEDGVAEAPAFSEREEFYKVPFLQAADLVRNRTVFLAGGHAFVPRARMVSALVAKFRAYLSYSLVQANKFLPAVLRDERLKPMLENMSKTYVGPEFGAGRKNAEHVAAADVEELAGSAFPLCMQNMHAGLREKHRLKHTGRLQYGLFLKGVGLPLDEALVFWQREFTKGMSPEDFIKKYAYNIRYNYGKEGKRTDFTPYSCVKVILSPPPASDEVHGCPFKNWDVSQLRAAMGRARIAPAAADAVADAVRGREYQVACRRHFEARFPGADSGSVGNHPNAYAEAATAFLKALAAGEQQAGAAAGAGGAAAPSSDAASAAAGAGASAAQIA